MKKNSVKQSQTLSRRHFVRLVAATATVIPTTSMILAACGDATISPSVATTVTATTAAAKTAVASTTTAAASTANMLPGGEGVPDAYFSLPAPFKSVKQIPGKGTTVKVLVWNSGGQLPIEKAKNKYWQELEKRLDVSWDVTIVPYDNYPEKLKLLAASGEMGELVLTDLTAQPDQNKSIQQGAYTDLTSYLSGEALKDYPNLAAFPSQLWTNSAIRGKIYGVPRPRFLTNQGLLWRKDWADKFNPAGPKNADEFYQLLDAFTNKDPDGDGQKNTWGIGDASTTDNISSLAANRHIMGMFRVPYPWKLNSDGSLTYFIETPEYKQYLEFMTKLWKDGLYYPDTPIQTGDQSRDNFVGGKFGARSDTVTGIPGASGRRAVAKSLNPKADIVMLTPVGFDGGKAYHYGGPGFYGRAMIPSKVGKDKERVKELLRIIDYFAAPFGSEERTFLDYGIEGVDHTKQADGTPVLTEVGNNEIGDLNYIMQGRLVLFYPGFPDQPKLVQDTIKTLLPNLYNNPALSAYSATYNARVSELNKVIGEGGEGIVTGRQPLSSLDKIISDWKSRGGDTVAKEYADSLKA